MSESPATIYLITGATRGLGLALVADIASKDSSAIIYAGARDPSSPGISQLKDVVGKYPGRIEVVKYIAADKEGNAELAKEIGKKHGRVDTVIANAGISNYLGKIHETPIHEFHDHFSVNLLGPLILFQSFYDLLKTSALPRFVPISSGGGSIEMIPIVSLDMGPYGPSKAALNWITRKIHFENEWIVSFPITPGGVNTDMMKRVVVSGIITEAQLEKFTRPPAVAASLIVDIIRGSTREREGGQFVTLEGKRNPW